MKILFAASEMTPFAKTGGLGDVVEGLPLALADLGHEVTCCLPFYRCVRHALHDLIATGIALEIPLGIQSATAELFEMRYRDKVRMVFVRHDEFFDRSELYNTSDRDYEDNAQRFLFFSKVVVELLALSRYKPDVVHCHDWHTGFVPAQVTYRRNSRGLAYSAKCVFTIHNLAYQGWFPGRDFTLTNLPGEFFTPGGLEAYGQMNLMKAGIVYADAVTTVSKRYAKEIQTEEFGCGLESVLRARRQPVTGIVNGADYRTWDPETDRALKQNYTAADLSGKVVCRTALLHRFGLEAAAASPVVAVITRLAEQKGVDILTPAVEELLKLGVVLVVLGKGDRRHEQLLLELAARHSRKMAMKVAHDEELAHQMQAGADVLLVPSRFEPCGLTQLYALKYGTIPVVRATGGLDDTVQAFAAMSGTGNGFKFVEYSSAAMVAAVQQAVSAFRKPAEWRQLMRNAMACDYSWRASAREYEKLYAAL